MFFNFLNIAVKDFFKFRLFQYSSSPNSRLIMSDKIHLDLAVAWIIRSIDEHQGNGSSKAYRFLKGWMPPYPETSGYIIKTLLELSEQDQKYLTYAEKLGEWLISIQMEDGGYVGREAGYMQKPVVFNTGQILLGLNYLYRYTKNSRYLESAKKAGLFLVSCLDEDGCYVKNTSNGIVHTYNVRVTWGLFELHGFTSDEKYLKAAEKNINWTLKQQSKVGLFYQNNFKEGGNAITHSIAYTMRGLLESYLITKNEAVLDSVRLTADFLVRKYGIEKKLVSEIGEDGKNLSSHICLTGYAQLAIVFLKLHQIESNYKYLNIGFHLIDDLKAQQINEKSNVNIRGAIKGSFPIYGAYAPMQFPNWATKFFIDALLLKKKLEINN